MPATKTVRLRSPQGADHGAAEIPAGEAPEVIRRGDLTFVRKTHDVYHLATCCIVPDEPTGG